MQYSCGIIYLLFSSEVHFMDKKIAVLTGGTSGIGMQTALALKNAGYTVYELSRRAQGVEGLNHLVADVTDEAAVKKAVDEIVAREGKIDVLVNNAGFGISGAVEFTKTEDAKRLFDTNFFGMVNMNRAVVPVMREAGQGRIVNISSVAGQIPIPFQTYYSAAKAATNSYTMALANELRPYGVTVCAVQPGDIKTGFTKAREKTVDGDDVYGGRIGRSVSRMEHDEQTGMDPAVAGKFIANVAMKKKVSPIYTIGASYSFLTFLTRLMSWKTMNKIIGAIYAK
ncbi:MAG TPA: short-chain dehydrogenase [Ruminococcaceae bacterium]|nr:short-chain dehydrogenase [Oscillospiraceae bacterium]